MKFSLTKRWQEARVLVGSWQQLLLSGAANTKQPPGAYTIVGRHTDERLRNLGTCLPEAWEGDYAYVEQGAIDFHGITLLIETWEGLAASPFTLRRSTLQPMRMYSLIARGESGKLVRKRGRTAIKFSSDVYQQPYTIKGEPRWAGGPPAILFWKNEPVVWTAFQRHSAVTFGLCDPTEAPAALKRQVRWQCVPYEHLGQLLVHRVSEEDEAKVAV